MKKYLKLILLIFTLLSIYFIYQKTKEKNIIYLPLGDTFLISEEYNYLDIVTEELKENQKLRFSTQEYLNSEQSLLSLYQDIKYNKKIEIEEKEMNIRHLLREANLLTLSIGLNDLREEVHKQKEIDLQTGHEIIANIENRLDQTINEIEKYYKGDIYLIGFYDLYPSNKEKSIMIKKLNIMYREYVKRNDIIFIDISDFRYQENLLYSMGNYLLLKEEGSKELARRILVLLKE